MLSVLFRSCLIGLGLLCCMDPLAAQFAPPAGVPGSTAIAADDPVFVAWGSELTIQRGPQQTGVDSLGNASSGILENAQGKAGENGSISLGDGGVATYYFDMPIYDGPGYDFAIFENGFSDDFLELGFVEVATDGVHYVRFPAQSLTDTAEQVGTFGLLDTRKIDQLAGKYRALYGTPFDLEILKNVPGLDVQRIHYIRIRDVVGSILPEYLQRDGNGRIINDPWPTPFPTSGFDLDALGVIHQRSVGVKASSIRNKIKAYPNLLAGGESVHFSNVEKGMLYIFQPDGQRFSQHALNPEESVVVQPEHTGIWYWYWESEGVFISGKFMVL